MDELTYRDLLNQPRKEEADIETLDEGYADTVRGLSEWARERLVGTELVRTVDAHGNTLVRYEMKQDGLVRAFEDIPLDDPRSRGWVTAMKVDEARGVLGIVDMQVPVPTRLLEGRVEFTPEDPDFRWCERCLSTAHTITDCEEKTDE